MIISVKLILKISINPKGYGLPIKILPMRLSLKIISLPISKFRSDVKANNFFLFLYTVDNIENDLDSALKVVLRSKTCISIESWHLSHVHDMDSI